MVDPGSLPDVDLSRLRHEYEAEGLDETHLSADPVDQFDEWFRAAVASGVDLPNTVVLATATPEGRPSARAVLLKGYDGSGFVFFTNYESRKGLELLANPHAALCFLWVPLHRQVRIEGEVHKVSAAESDAYFAVRPMGARLSAVASPQSRVVPSRAHLERQVATLAEQHTDNELPRPEHWGGFRLVPESFEFWQGRGNRLHDRLRYGRNESAWHVERLAP